MLELARDRVSGAEDLEVVERQFGIGEVVQAHEEGRLLEAFVCGTAFFVCSVREICWKDRRYYIPVSEDWMGRYAGLIKGWLKGIMYGKERNEWGYVVEENEV